MKKDLLLAIDVGTGSVRAALITATGETAAFSAREHDQIVPQFGWAEQRPESWWEGAAASIRAVLATMEHGPHRVAGVATCGQMHGTVLIDDDGILVRDRVPLWNDKRTREIVEDFQRNHDITAIQKIVGNPPTVAFAAFKLMWIKHHEPKTYAAARTLLMPKDYINFRLTGARAIDISEASCNYLLDIGKRTWSEEIVNLVGLDLKMLPPLKNASDVLGRVMKEAARETGLLEGTPVVVGAGDYPVTLLGSGVTQPGMGSDVTGTSTLITLMVEQPVLDPAITNVQGVAGGWGAFTILDAGGDAMRWARRAFHDNQYSYERIVKLAGSVAAGADRLIFLPYLNGERLAKQTNSRAQFVGLTSGHTGGHLHRAVMEGVAFASRRNIEIMKSRGNKLDRLVASGGGAKTRLWLEIKASVYGCPILTPADPECGVLGCAMLAGVGAGIFFNIDDAVRRLVRYDAEIQPDPSLSERYEKMATFFDKVYSQSETYWNELEKL
ncbi:MAG: pentose kinase [Verrucomicrobia bacterium]|nr:pentose kinase [Verrucomicrobiota bacterium]